MGDESRLQQSRRNEDVAVTTQRPSRKVAIAALKGDQTLAVFAAKFDIYPNLITQWKT